MDSLVASYASSDEEDEQVRQPRRQSVTVKSSEPSSSSSSSLFSVLPQPQISKSSQDPSLAKSSPFLSSLPPPKSSITPSISKRVVQIRLPVNPRPTDFDDDDEEEEKARKKRKQMESAASHDSSVKSFLSAMPAPKSSQTLGALPTLGSGLGRRSNLETETPAVSQTESGNDQIQSYGSFNSETEQIAGYGQYPSGSGDVSGNGGGYEQNPSASSGDGSGYVGYDGSSWNGGGFEATTGLPEAFVAMDSGARRGRRGRDKMPPEIVEVKQDELMKNRPRADQVKATGIAFGPAYQPASSSSKGKVSKLHKRKHQITSLFMDMKQKETELAERRSRGLLTKSETQAKYGW